MGIKNNVSTLVERRITSSKEDLRDST